MTFIFGIVLAYLVGSIPTAYIFGKLLKGIDIRQHGSGNVGATNVFRCLGKGPGFIVLFLDILKGVLPVVVIGSALGLTENIPLILLAFAAVAGHNWTVFLNFKGGKGVATSLGVLIGLMIKIAGIRIVVLGTFLVWVVTFLISSIVSISSILAALALPGLMIIYQQPPELLVLGLVFGGFIIIRHWPNIKRLLAGSEPRVKLPFRK